MTAFLLSAGLGLLVDVVYCLLGVKSRAPRWLRRFRNLQWLLRRCPLDGGVLATRGACGVPRTCAPAWMETLECGSMPGWPLAALD